MSNKLKIYFSNGNFIISNKITNLESIDGAFNYLSGYVFSKYDLLKNETLKENDVIFIEENKENLSGIFCFLKQENHNIKLLLDPLVQFNIFYHKNGEELSISNNILMLKDFCGISKTNENFIFDVIAYNSPLRGSTLIDGLYRIQFDDVYYNNEKISDKVQIPLVFENLEILVPNINKHSDLDYFSLKELFISNLKRRAEIVSNKYDEIYIQLTGGADSRLVLSGFLGHKNISCYVYGDGTSQNRLIFERITSKFNINKSESIPFKGRTLNTAGLMAKGLVDSNFMKFNNLNTYVNSGDFLDKNICKITGYYGVNISGNMGLPPEEKLLKYNKKTEKFNTNLFSYHDYIKNFKEVHKKKRPINYKDIFYLNNRGASHYAAHSLADNKYCNSYDILYDPLNLLLADKSPYLDDYVVKKVLSVDIISDINEELALFPYDSRKIPVFKNFKKNQPINCFTGFDYKIENLSSMNFMNHNVDISEYDFIEDMNINLSKDDILRDAKFSCYLPEIIRAIEFDTLPSVVRENLANLLIARYFLEKNVVKF